MDGTKGLSTSINRIEKLEEWLNNNDIAKEDICLIGSCALSARGIRENNDLEFVIKPKIYKEHNLSRNIFWITYAVDVAEHVELWRNQLYRIGITDKRLFKKKLYDVIDGYNVVYIDVEKLYKEEVGREKDWMDLKSIEAYIHEKKYGKTIRDRLCRYLFLLLQFLEFIGNHVLYKLRKKWGIGGTNPLDEVHLHLWW